MIEILDFTLSDYSSDRFEELAAFDVRIGDIRMRECKLRYKPEFRRLYVTLPGSKAGVTLDEATWTRQIIIADALRHYLACCGMATVEGGGRGPSPADGRVTDGSADSV